MTVTIEREDVQLEEGLAVVGVARDKVDALAKAMGQTKYADDLNLPRMLIGKFVRSSYRHARITRIDVSRALALKGVHAVLTGKDLPIRFGISRARVLGPTIDSIPAGSMLNVSASMSTNTGRPPAL